MNRPTCSSCIFCDCRDSTCHEDSPKAELARFTSQFSRPELATLWPPVAADGFCGRHRDEAGVRAYQDPVAPPKPPAPSPAPVQPAATVQPQAQPKPAAAK